MMSITPSSNIKTIGEDLKMLEKKWKTQNFEDESGEKIWRILKIELKSYTNFHSKKNGNAIFEKYN